jgi:hypothetical protein
VASGGQLNNQVVEQIGGYFAFLGGLLGSGTLSARCGSSQRAPLGRTAGRGESILDVLEARGLDVSEAERSRITNCTDRRQLKKWLKRAVTAEKVADLFAWKLAEARGASRCLVTTGCPLRSPWVSTLISSTWRIRN